MIAKIKTHLIIRHYFQHCSVLVPPRIVPFSFEEPIFAGQSVQVACSVSAGDSPIQIEWKFSGGAITADLGIEIQSLGRRGSALILDSADSRHGGNYTCSATNAAGIVQYTTSLNVHGNVTIPSWVSSVCCLCFVMDFVLILLPLVTLHPHHPCLIFWP